MKQAGLLRIILPDSGWKLRTNFFLKQGRRHGSKEKSSKKHRSDDIIDKDHSDKVRERLNSSENGEERHRRKDRKPSRGRSYSRSRSRVIVVGVVTGKNPDQGAEKGSDDPGHAPDPDTVIEAKAVSHTLDQKSTNFRHDQKMWSILPSDSPHRQHLFVRSVNLEFNPRTFHDIIE
ncbi:hypothetical protein AB205_0049200 [Aquarana catesbeiana]|uniref:Uncharacterized protein n=1 Tax=Aquarana catesbeiana TaxID=8400 RepID=A0A2G9SCX3_AQUCT|nr:hypothetical protein AB205_0049200 [Aquarana catesbeiana]